MQETYTYSANRRTLKERLPRNLLMLKKFSTPISRNRFYRSENNVASVPYAAFIGNQIKQLLRAAGQLLDRNPHTITGELTTRTVALAANDVLYPPAPSTHRVYHEVKTTRNKRVACENFCVADLIHHYKHLHCTYPFTHNLNITTHTIETIQNVLFNFNWLGSLCGALRHIHFKMWQVQELHP